MEPDEDDGHFKPGLWKQDSASLAGVAAGRQPEWPAPSLGGAQLWDGLVRVVLRSALEPTHAQDVAPATPLPRPCDSFVGRCVRLDLLDLLDLHTTTRRRFAECMPT